MAFPIINMEKLIGKERAATMALINDACENWGFFEILNHRISPELMDKVERLTKHYKERMEQRFKEAGKIIELGWESTFQLKHLRLNPIAQPYLSDDEYSIKASHSQQLRVERFQLPEVEVDDVYINVMMEYSKKIKKLAEELMELFCLNLGIDKIALKCCLYGWGEPVVQTRVATYPSCPRFNHTDAGVLSLLLQDGKVNGLKLLKGDQWINVPPTKHSIVISLGDQLEVITNGKYKSVMHRVMPQTDRMSIASFYNPFSEAAISPIPKLQWWEPKTVSCYPSFQSKVYMDLHHALPHQTKKSRFEAIEPSSIFGPDRR